MRSILVPGLYALASLDGSPLSPADRELLHLAPGDTVQESTGLAVSGWDPLARTSVISFHRTGDTLLALAGYLDEPEELAAKLGADPGASPSSLALLAVDRFGADAPRLMVGEWSLLRWSASTRELTLLCSENLRDPMFWASNGSQIAVASDVLRLGTLPWVGLSLNPLGFALSVSRAGIRRIRKDETVWKGIYAVSPATREVFTAGSRQTLPASPEPAPEAWQGSFEDAVDALNSLCRRIVGQNLRRYSRSGFLLSGGIDSTLVTVLGARERQTAGEMFCVTSVAPDGSGLPDEREFAASVAGQLGLRQSLVFPPSEANPYRPSSADFQFQGQPILASRHCLYAALRHAARSEGANALFDGVMGEMSITEKPILHPELAPLRKIMHAGRRWYVERVRRCAWPEGGFHARLRPGFLHDLPTSWHPLWRAGMPQQPHIAAHQPRGFHPALAKNTAVGSATPEGLRRIFPFRDRRLIRFAAGLPYGFGQHSGETRAMARAMLRGHVPESVRLRPRGLPISPDFERRIAEHALATRRRVHVFREAGLGNWLDLVWLDSALQRIAEGARVYNRKQNQAQFTAMVGEFLLWCREAGIRL